MWEDAMPPAVPAAPPRSRHRERGGRDRLLAAQLAVCAAALGAVLAARALGLPVFARLRVAYTAALAADGTDILDGQRRFARFAQDAAAALEQAAAAAWAQMFAPQAGAPQASASPSPAPTPSAPVLTPAPGAAWEPSVFSAVRAVRGKNPPAGSSAQTYLPPFTLSFPLPGGAWAHTSAYGWRTDPVSGQGTAFHKGADLAAAEGTPVLAAAAGVVRSAGKSASYGNWLRILHPGGDETLYAHLQYLFVHAGQSVAPGQRLGTVGQTGHATGPHLHFELLHEGVRYDPAQALQAAV